MHGYLLFILKLLQQYKLMGNAHPTLIEPNGAT